MVMIESHLELVYLPRGSATAWLNRPDGLNQSNTESHTLTTRGDERRGDRRRGEEWREEERRGGARTEHRKSN